MGWIVNENYRYNMFRSETCSSARAEFIYAFSHMLPVDVCVNYKNVNFSLDCILYLLDSV